MTSQLVHASCVCIGGKGVLLLGESGAGKSDLAIRLIDGGATLVADDQVSVGGLHGRLSASAPEKLRGMIEVRGVGILHLPHQDNIPLALAVRLVARDREERMPEPALWSCHGLKLPLLSLHAFDESTPVKIRLALASME